jgi:dTDP-4-dehydrorhamnose 3,5-epimerase
MLRRGDPGFDTFGEIYFSEVHEGAVKSWRRHLENVSRLAVPVGCVRVALLDGRTDSPTLETYAELIIGRNNYQLITVPPGVWTLFFGIGPGPSLIANCSDAPHDPAEVERAEVDDLRFPSTWNV